jgi:hypothetical protein
MMNLKVGDKVLVFSNGFNQKLVYIWSVSKVTYFTYHGYYIIGILVIKQVKEKII